MKEKLELLKDLKDKQMVYKVMPTLMAIDYEDLKKNLSTLLTIGITIKKLSQIKICALKPSELVKRADYIKQNLLGEKFVKNPLLLLDVSQFETLEEQDIQIPVNEEVQSIQENMMSDSIIPEEEPEVNLEDVVNQEVVLSTPEYDEDLVEEEDDRKSILDLLNSTEEVNPVEDEKIQPIDVNSILDKEPSFLEDDKTPGELIKDVISSDTEASSGEEKINSVSSFDSIDLTADNFSKYSKLSDVANLVIKELDNENITKNNELYECLSLNINAGKENDECLYEALTHNKEIDSDLQEKIKTKIKEVLERVGE